MDSYITGATIRYLRDNKGLTQSQLAEKIGVSAKTISKWETAKGLPDIALIEPLANALGVSVLELMSGNMIYNRNVSSNILHSNFYVCPICGNAIMSIGKALVCCCGITLPVVEADEAEEFYKIDIIDVEDEKFVSINHDMTKTHYISFMAYLTTDRVVFQKFYPEGNAETRIRFTGRGYLYIFCNKHGLMKMKI